LAGRGRALLVSLVVGLSLTFALQAGWLASQAWADGDPASDVLASQSLFLPGDAGIPAAQQQRLSGLLSSAQRSGFPVRVAVVASPADLGSITELWRQPENYARFLGQELGLVFKGTLLVAMPNGYGVYAVGGTGSPTGGAAANPALAGLPAPGAGPALGTAAATAVQHLAAAAGHELALPSAPGSASGSRSGSVDIAGWIAFAAGLALIGLAWAASLRARPLRRGAA
jgi:hypothetical protein